jgi:UDPglucose 6-dehydrogenase
MKVGFAGLSHLGLNYSLATAAKGFDVIAYDADTALAAACTAGRFPIEEPGFTELFTTHRGRLTYTADRQALAACDLVFFALDVKTNERNESDLGPLTALIESVAPVLRPGSTAVVLSQVNPGYMRGLAARLAPNSPAAFYYQVETLIFGRAVERAMEPERYMVGAADPSAPLPAAFTAWHKPFGCPVLVMRFESAELAKIAINFYLVSTVTTTNTLAEVCEAIGADWSEIAPALRLDKRIGPYAYLKPGLGIAGGNLERDLVTVQRIAAQHGTDTGVVSAWQANSAYRKDWALRMVHREVLAHHPDARLAVWGIAYKEDTHSIKNSPSVSLIEGLVGQPIQAYDPAAVIDLSKLPHVTRVGTADAALVDADALVIMTPWKEFAAKDPAAIKQALRGRVVIDPFGVLSHAACERAHLRSLRLGQAGT